MLQKYSAILSVLQNLIQNKRILFWSFAAVLLLMTLYMTSLFYPLRGAPRYDFYFHYNRLYIIIQSFENGTFPFYMDNNVLNGYGYFTKAFYPDLMLLPFAVIGYFTGLYAAYQSLLFTVTFLCGIFTYIAIAKIYKSSYAAAIGSLLFTFAGYRFFALYYGGMVGISIAYTLMPLVSWGVYELLCGNYKKWYILAIAYFCLINTHVISTFIIFMAMLVFLAIYYKSFVREPVRLKYLAVSGAAALLASSYFLLPFIEQLLSNSFRFQSPTFRGDEMKLQTVLYNTFSYLKYDVQLGIGGLATAMIFLRLFIKSAKTPQLKSADYGVIMALVCIFICGSYFPWNVFPFTLLHFIQFPWRFLQISIYLTAIGGGFYISLLLAGYPVRKFLFLLFIVLLSCYGMRFGQGEYFNPETPVITAADMSFPKTVVGAEYLPAKVPSINYPEKRGDKITALHNDTEVSLPTRQKNGLTFALRTNRQEVLELPLIYYKGYRAELDGKEIEVRESRNGLIELTAGKSGDVKVYYAGTAVQKISVWLTLLSLLAMLACLLREKIRR
ncbi:MAG: hypothetical protein LBR34_11085 [Prevotella sp.]|jgi:hypothetical protein|nr:hypothetical protein [Prevotella sp.]